MKGFYTALIIAVLLGFNFAASAQFNETDIVITEISYNPAESGTDSLEYIELYNTGTTSVNLTGYTFTQGIEYTFGNVTLAPGNYVVVAIDAGAMQNVFGVSTLQWTTGGLNNGGETIELRTAATGGTLVDIVAFDDAAPWPVDADQGGPSLVLCDPLSDNNLGTNWRAATTSIGVTINSLDVKGNPLAADPCPVPCPDITAGLSGVVSNVSCNAGANGAVTLTVSTGTAPFTYLWSSGDITKDISGKAAGSFSVTVTDDNGCTGTQSFTITEPTALSITSVPTDVSCNGGADGSVDATATGGAGTYTYLWSNGATTQDISSIGVNTYTVTVNDANSCTAVTTATVNEPSALAATATPTNVTCNGSTDGSIDLSVSGGVTPYTYLWSNAATTQDIASLGAGSYSVTVTDDNNCTYTDNYTITEPAGVTLSGVSDDASCNGAADGAINLTVSGGTAPITYAWSNSATTEDLTGIAAGNYVVTVTYGANCTATDSYTVSEPPAITLTGIAANASCAGNDGGIGLSVSGGTAPYTYAWSNSAITEDITGVGAGNYGVTVTDANGCSAADSYTVTSPSAATLSGVVIDATCNGATDGSIDLTVTGGAAPYTFAWSNSASTEDLTAVAAGTFGVTVTDNNGCVSAASYTVTEPAAATLNGVVDNATCNGGADGAIDLTVAGGVAPYTYAWSNSATTEDVTGLAAGTYGVTVTDDNGCTASASYTVTQSGSLALTAIITDASCLDSLDGEVALTVTGGTAPYTYLWDNAATTATLTGLAVGDYTVTVTDDNACVITETATVGFVDSCNTVGILSPVVIDNGLAVYPNPAANSISVELNGNWQASAVSLHSFSGSLVAYQTLENNAGTVRLDVSELPEGIYLVTVQATDGRLARTKVIVAGR